MPDVFVALPTLEETVTMIESAKSHEFMSAMYDRHRNVWVVRITTTE